MRIILIRKNEKKKIAKTQNRNGKKTGRRLFGFREDIQILARLIARRLLAKCQNSKVMDSDVKKRGGIIEDLP